MSDIAIVTGASAGLGVLFAEALAAEKRDLLLIARREDRLHALADRLIADHQIKVHCLPLDLAMPDAPSAVTRFLEREGLHCTTLINNAGFGARGGFAELDGSMQIEMIDLNIRALTALCHAMLPGMIAAKRGEILNVASTAAFQPGPWMAVYYATKAYVLSFSEALHEEMKGKGVHVSALCPGATKTEFAAVADMESSTLFKTMAGDPKAVVADGLAALRANDAVRVSGVANKLMAASIRLTPRFLARQVAGAMQK